ncbi:hypothetical protein, partial [Acinetobacter schindleri]|uniref:hypothetical protein n=1 Tax=Acinetobacter schindleri TaxID=108981 RepID=UPI00289B5797
PTALRDSLSVYTVLFTVSFYPIIVRILNYKANLVQLLAKLLIYFYLTIVPKKFLKHIKSP